MSAGSETSDGEVRVLAISKHLKNIMEITAADVMIDFETWYSPWMKLLARSYTAEELQAKLHDAEAQARVAAKNRFRVIWHTHTLDSTRNISASDSDYAIILRGAIEIHRLFPEEASRPTTPRMCRCV